MSSFNSCKLFKFKYVIFLLTHALFIISQKCVKKYSTHDHLCSSSLIFLFFDLCYETGGSNVGKTHLLYRYANENFFYFKEGKKTFSNEHTK